MDKIMSETWAYREIAETYLLDGKQVAEILRVSIATANRRIRLVKELNNVKKYHKINLFMLCKQFDLNVKCAVLKEYDLLKTSEKNET
jgi:hypothetical protein